MIRLWSTPSRTIARSCRAKSLRYLTPVAARYVVLTRRMVAIGPNLGGPHTKAFGDGLFELRLKGAEGLGRVFFCTLVGRRIVMLHCFMKKSDKTPKRELDTARIRMKEIKRANP